MKKWIAGFIVDIGIMKLIVYCKRVEENREGMKSMVKEMIDKR